MRTGALCLLHSRSIFGLSQLSWLVPQLEPSPLVCLPVYFSQSTLPSSEQKDGPGLPLTWVCVLESP